MNGKDTAPADASSSAASLENFLGSTFSTLPRPLVNSSGRRRGRKHLRHGILENCVIDHCHPRLRLCRTCRERWSWHHTLLHRAHPTSNMAGSRVYRYRWPRCVTLQDRLTGRQQGRQHGLQQGRQHGLQQGRQQTLSCPRLSDSRAGRYGPSSLGYSARSSRQLYDPPFLT